MFISARIRLLVPSPPPSPPPCSHPLLGVYLTNPRTTPAAECQALVASVFRQGADVATPADVERACSMLSKLSVVRTGEIKVREGTRRSLCLCADGGAT